QPGQPAPGQPAPGQPAPGQPAPGQPAPGQAGAAPDTGPTYSAPGSTGGPSLPGRPGVSGASPAGGGSPTGVPGGPGGPGLPGVPQGSTPGQESDPSADDAANDPARTQPPPEQESGWVGPFDRFRRRFPPSSGD
ncbi:hypothetical protein AB0K82_42035, partial [Actinoallomurus sp. NPDC052274]